ncbi:MAG: DUF86 domain-containing protein [Microcystis aeruginosa Ma_QC_Ch_20071001_S25]|jgi:uncharacterized protein with HEPN domain|uniref:DUF86 domain-containing protein n=4 Tax=Microcystis aeruginosa TaxID=1126 RepID=A0A552G1R0_MICAE|nr:MULTISPECIES: HepT-like ribonuclease domain-containing protein [unclassified Microcystis]MCA2762583.1 DUF86 domain-containing protein [Microcystis sp. M151S2]MCA2925787.1 DUF86 domain-containing protein [Microcystis sp. M020S1]MCA2935731.1 DUF86 domain-containing protein [Microcystis sp. M015S1]MCU7242169.1 DUF86 domain-containing protein [Microcystis aeruginosa WS75]NCR10454.1 DUF86 domain-containing protein [Microcystis aeruginosa LG13-11]NCR27776.1 DUF86 domain-containing protein [Micro
MCDRSLLFELLLELEEAIRRIERRFTQIQKADDFIADDDGLDRLDGISMMLIAISENIRRLDRLMGESLANRYPEIPWSEIKGIRNILAHDYFDIDPEEIYRICREDLEILKRVLGKIRHDLL